MTMLPPKCLPVDAVVAINSQQTKGRGRLLDDGGLEAALCAPLQ